MHMQKKITRKEDGRFLVYYHFPDTATTEETQVFESIEEIAAETADGRPKTEEEKQSTIDNRQSPIVNPQPEAAHV